jgi:hypothetical protein
MVVSIRTNSVGRRSRRDFEADWENGQGTGWDRRGVKEGEETYFR